MTEPRLKIQVGLFLIAGHFLAILLVLFLRLAGAFSQDELTTTLAIIGPFFAAYTTAIIRHIIRTRHDPAGGSDTRLLSSAFVLLSFALPALFVLLVIGAVVLKGFNVGIRSFEDFKVILGALEVSFGVYVGQLMQSLFEVGSQEGAESGDQS